MDGNYSCSLCPQVAVQCCLCSTSRTYLCQTCVQPHTSSKRVYHPLVPVSTPASVTKDNLAEYDRRMTALGKLRGQLEAVSAQLTAERSGLDQAFNDIYNQQTQRLYQVCFDIYADINAYYVRIHADIEVFKQEINKTEQSQNVTDVARKYIEVGLHLVQPIAFLDIRGEMSRRIQVTATGDNLRVQDCLMTAFRLWKTAPCSCSDCSEIKTALLGTNQYWSCQMCGLHQNWATNCYQCRASNPAKMRSFSRSGYSLPNAYPTIPQCSTCGVDCGGRCTSQRAQPSNSASFTPVNVQSPINTTPNTHNPAQGYNPQPAPMTLTRYRKCRYCGDNFQGAQLCSKCRYPDEGDRWKCFGCENLNPAANEMCYRCNASKYLGLYLSSRGEVTLTEDRREWVCKCEAKTQIYVPKCSGCGKESKIVQKALEYDGNPKGWGERFGKALGF